MWIEELTLENIRCFEKVTMTFAKDETPSQWINFLSENGGGKSTALQAMGLLLAGPEGAQQLLSHPLGWVRNEDQPGKISTRIHQSNHDPGKFGEQTIRRAFGYTYFITGSKPITIRNKQFTEAAIVENKDKLLTWLRRNAFTSKGKGWFAVGYGAFRRLTRDSGIIVPSMEVPARFTNFISQFDESQSLTTLEQWLVYLDYRIFKSRDKEAKRQKELGVTAINQILPEGVTFDSVTTEGRILFNVGGQKVATIALSEGYRSVLALTGDLVWRLLVAFPDSDNPFSEEGVVLIDELDNHLHPLWQRDIASKLREQFPRLQFFVATHSPLVAAGAGEDALTYRFDFKAGKSAVKKVENNIAFWNVDQILQSEAFGLVSPYAPQVQRTIDQYDRLKRKKSRTPKEQEQLDVLLPVLAKIRPFGDTPEPDSLEGRIATFLNKKLS